MNYLHPFLLIFLIYGFLGCSTGPEFERNNPNDPSSKGFVTDQAEAGTFSIGKQREIHLSWNKETNFHDGYLIYKRITSDSDYVQIDRLKKWQTNFTDYSQKFSLETAYRVNAFSLIDDSLVVNYQEPLTIDIILSSFRVVDVKEVQDSVRIQWEFIPTSGHFNFLDGFKVDVKDHKTGNWIAYDTLKVSYNELQQPILFQKPQTIFNLEFRLQSFIYDHNSEIKIIDTNTYQLSRTIVSNLNFTILDEITGKLNWTNNSSSIKGYYIYDENNLIDSVKSLQNSFEFRYPFPPGEYRFYLQPFSENGFGKKVASNLERFNRVPAPEDLSLIDKESEVITLNWSSSSQYPGGFIIYRKSVQENVFLPIDTVGKNTFSYQDFDVDISKQYQYKLTTYYSHPGKTITVNFGDILVNEIINEHGFNNNRYFRDTFSELIVGINEEDEEIQIYDKSFNFVQQKPLNGIEYINRSGYMVLNAVFNKDQNLLAFLTTSQYKEYWNYVLLHVYDLNSDSFLIKNYKEFNQAFRMQFSPRDSEVLYIVNGNSGEEIIQFNISEISSTTIPISGYVHHIYDNSNADVIIHTNEINQLLGYDTQSKQETLISDTEVRIIDLDHKNSKLYFRDKNLITSYDLLDNISQDISLNSIIELNDGQKISDTPYLFTNDYSGVNFFFNFDNSSATSFSLTNINSEFRFLIPIAAHYPSTDRIRFLSTKAFHTFDISRGWSIIFEAEQSLYE